MTKRVLIAAGLVAALTGGSALALAQPPQPGPGIRGGFGREPGPRGPRGGLADFGLRGIQLTDAQRDQARSIMESHKAEFDEVATRLREAHRAFAEAAQAATLDETTIRSRSAAVAGAMADEALLRARVRSEVHAILTPEQLQQLAQRRAEMERRMLERSQRKPQLRQRGQ